MKMLYCVLLLATAGWAQVIPPRREVIDQRLSRITTEYIAFATDQMLATPLIDFNSALWVEPQDIAWWVPTSYGLTMTNGAGRMVVSLADDGTVTFGEGFTAGEAAKELWRLLALNKPPQSPCVAEPYQKRK